MQLLGEVLALLLLALYNSSTTSSTSRLLGKCAAIAEETTFWFSFFVAVNLVDLLMINGFPFSVRVTNGCAIRRHPFSRAGLMRWPDALSCHQLMKGYDIF